MNPQIFERLIELIAARTGLQAREKDRADWCRALEARIKALRLDARPDGPREYFLKLDAAAPDDEWPLLLPLLTNGESYFLRDKGQFALLRDQIFPDLLEKRRSSRSLRLWSAGCSTGEEPYSLAILASEIVPPDWNVSIFGTDVNPDALHKARRGQYGAWSFRGLDQALRDRFFAPKNGGYELKADLRARVRFETDNLCAAQPNPTLCDMDLILCRNVLIYFRREAVARALARFSGALREGGFLLTGHAELHQHDPAPLLTRFFPASVIYERVAASQNAPQIEPQTASQSAPRPKFQGQPTAQPTAQAAILPTKTARNVATKTVPARNATSPPASISTSPPASMPITASPALSAPEWCRRAQSEADAGRHDEAIFCCQQALKQDAFSVEAYALWAHVAGEQGERETAKSLFKKVIYLAPTQFEAYLELGALYDFEGDFERARRMHEAALDGLRAATGAKSQPEHEVLRRHLESLLAKPVEARRT